MGILIKKQKGLFTLTGIARLAVTGFIVSLSAAFVDTIWAVYMDGFVNSAVIVGFISAALTVLSFISYFLLIPLIEKIDKSQLYLFTLFTFAIGYILLVINKNFYIFLAIAISLTVLANLKITSFGIIIKDKSRRKNLSRNEGLMYTFFNLAWVIGPLVAGYLSEGFGMNLIFIMAAIFLFIAATFFIIAHIHDGRVKKNVDKNLIKNFIGFFKEKNRVYCYIISGGVSLWWILIYLFIPIHIIESGLDIIWVGYFLFAIAVPLILLEFVFSKLASKIGFRKMFVTGFSITAISALLCFFIPNIYVILGVLVLGSIGMSMLEPTTEAYFFDVTKSKDEQRFYGPYNTSIDVNQFIGKVLSSLVLIFLPFQYLFLLFAFLMIALVIVSFKAKNVVEAIPMMDELDEEKTR